MHFDFGQLHPVGLSCKGPNSRVAEHSKTSLSNRPSNGLARFAEGGDGEEFHESLERFPILSSVGDSVTLGWEIISWGMTMSFGITTLDACVGVEETRPPREELLCGM